jgi:hypothetical protein
MRALLHKYLPLQFRSPVRLAIRLLRSKNPAALFAMATALLGVLCLPIDLVLQIPERRRYRKARAPKLPLIFVVGPPRSGTTLVAQVLITHLPVCYINNLTAVFPRAPITANAVFGWPLRTSETGYQSYYGKTPHFYGPNDALYIWDRWLGKDRGQVPPPLSNQQKEDMIRFFGAYQEACPKPLVNKVNRFVTCAQLVADVLNTSHFICLRRDPVYLAQSLLRARLDIHGDATIPYGVTNPDLGNPQGDYVKDVCDQVAFYENKIAEQLAAIGPRRFWVISYEDFCRNPSSLVRRVSEQILGQIVDPTQLRDLPALKSSNQARLDEALLARIRESLARCRTA